eukprot:6474804-Amphidinium_carterae.1
MASQYPLKTVFGCSPCCLTTRDSRCTIVRTTCLLQSCPRRQIEQSALRVDDETSQDKAGECTFRFSYKRAQRRFRRLHV